MSEAEILKIKEYVPPAICNVEMLFLSPDERGKGFGKMIVRYGIENYSAEKVTVNEQNPKAKGFYEHLGFKTYKTSETDEQGNPYPIAWMKLEKTRRVENLNLGKNNFA
ncbi:MAG: GNAT family N-acetyltransferase [Spirochaetales bacterium]|nr:GNAT family N-acetyltransferase [Spirochaetales bacterium]